ncbi:hypothetical protein [Herbidospora sp. RD11066]
MYKKMAAATVAAAFVMLPATAHAAPAANGPCWAGSWTVARATADVAGKKVAYSVEGGAGTRMTITPSGKRAIVAYDFGTSASLTGANGSLTMSGADTYTYTFGGYGPNLHGKVALKPRTGTGGATLIRVGGKGFTGPLRNAVARNEDLGAIPRKGTYTCVPGTSLRIATYGKSGTTTVAIAWDLTRA